MATEAASAGKAGLMSGFKKAELISRADEKLRHEVAAEMSQRGCAAGRAVNLAPAGPGKGL